MATAYANTAADALAAIISAGVARYQESLPEDFRQPQQFFGEPVSDEEAQVESNVSRVTEERQRELCLNCHLTECVDVTDSRCPIRIEARRLWRKRN